MTSVKRAFERIREYHAGFSKPGSIYPHVLDYKLEQASVGTDFDVLGQAKFREMIPAGGKNQIEPQEIGYYFWYILDMNYFECGVVNVVKDSPGHLKRLRELPPEAKKSFYIYTNELGETMTMYHQAAGGPRPHLPPVDHTARPHVDLYVPFDMANLPIVVQKLVPRDLPT